MRRGILLARDLAGAEVRRLKLDILQLIRRWRARKARKQLVSRRQPKRPSDARR